MPAAIGAAGWAGIAAAGIGAVGSIVASGQQQGAASGASGAELQMFNQTSAAEQPFIQGGAASQWDLGLLMGTNPGAGGNVGNAPLTTPYSQLYGQFNFDPTQIANNPQYQWQMQQGSQAVLNNASQLGGVGGNALQALTGYGQGLASQNYNNYFTNALNTYNTNQSAYTGWQNQVYNMLAGQSSAGQNAAANVANQGTTVGGQVGSNIIGAGNSAAAGTVGATNSLTAGANNYVMYQQLQQLQQNQGANLYNTTATDTSALGTI